MTLLADAVALLATAYLIVIPTSVFLEARDIIREVFNRAQD